MIVTELERPDDDRDVPMSVASRRRLLPAPAAGAPLRPSAGARRGRRAGPRAAPAPRRGRRALPRAHRRSSCSARSSATPPSQLAPVDATQEQVEQIRHNLGLDRPLVEQAGDYYTRSRPRATSATRWSSPATRTALDAGRRPAAGDHQADARRPARSPASLGVVPGIVAGVRPNSLFDRVGNVVALAGVSFPYFWFGQLLILVFAVNLRWVDVLPTTASDRATSCPASRWASTTAAACSSSSGRRRSTS